MCPKAVDQSRLSPEGFPPQSSARQSNLSESRVSSQSSVDRRNAPARTQVGTLVTPGSNGSRWSRQSRGGEARCGAAPSPRISLQSLYSISHAVCEADQSEHLQPTLCLLTKFKTAAITETQWRGKSPSAKSFLQLHVKPNLLRRVSFLLVMDLSHRGLFFFRPLVHSVKTPETVKREKLEQITPQLHLTCQK